MRREEWAPGLDFLEEEAAAVVRELERLMDTARNELRRIQDYDAETADAPPAVPIARYSSAHRLRCIWRQLRRAQLELVHPSDARFGAARKLLAGLDEVQRQDAPWRDPDDADAAA